MWKLTTELVVGNISTPSSRRSYWDVVASIAWGGRNLISTQVHQKPDGSTQWLWHACVACARASGQLRTHARFGDIRSCPLSADVAVPCATKPLGDASNKNVQDTLSKHREDMIRRYAGERDDLMAALGAALTNLHSIGASYPRWIWDRYERGRTASVPASWAYTSKSGV